jgi:hypothetical protein
MIISPKVAVDPAIQQIFDEMLAYMGTDYVSMNCFANLDGSATTTGVSCTSNTPSHSWTFTLRQAGQSVPITPMSANLGPGGTQQFSAAVLNPDGGIDAEATVIWTVSGAGGGTIDATGLYTAPATIAAAVNDIVRAAVTGGTSWTTVTVSLHP